MKVLLLLSVATSVVISISISDKVDHMMMAESREGPYVKDQDAVHPLMKMFMDNIHQPHNPYAYMKDPMASVPFDKATPYHHKNMQKPYHGDHGHNEDHAHPYGDHGHNEHNEDHPHPHGDPHSEAHEENNSYFKAFKNLISYMAGEKYFKNQEGDIINFLDESKNEHDEEELPYEVIQNYGNYKKRKIPSASYVCVQDKVDTAADPLAGLTFNGIEDAIEVMQSRRWNKRPSSKMFKKLFKYISGVNDRTEEINMTRPVTTLHHVEKKDYLGNVEVQEMCFYLPQKYQANHIHQGDGQDGGPSPRHARHAAVMAPQPLDDSVFLHTRPSMTVYVRQFGGFVMSAEQWVEHKEALEEDLLGKPHHDNEFFTVGYDSPFAFNNRRNEVWIQCLEPGQPVVEAVVAAGPHHDNDLDNDHEGTLG